VDAFVIEEARRNLAAKYTAALATLDSLLGRMQRLLASTARLAVPPRSWHCYRRRTGQCLQQQSGPAATLWSPEIEPASDPSVDGR